MQYIAIDTRPLFFTRGGIVSYLRSLISALIRVAPDNRYALLCPKSGSGLLHESGIPEAAWHTLRLPLHNRLLESVWENLLVPAASLRNGFDLIHFPRFAVPRLRVGRTVVTVHDLSYHHHPEALVPRARRYFEAVTAKAVARADAVIAVSNRTRQDLLDLYPIPPERVHVVHNGVESRFCPDDREAARERIQRSYGLQEEYFLFMGTLEPRKNVVGLLKAYAIFLESDRSRIPLILAGGKGWMYDEIFQTAESLGLGDRVRFRGHVPGEDQPDLYRAARAFVYPSLYEGFGLPVVEAMACGLPVVTSNTSSLPEVAGDAALLVDPASPEAIAEAMTRLAGDSALAEDLRSLGLKRAARFSWDEAARGTLDVYAQTLS